MGTIVAWTLLGLGIAHVAFGLVRFRKELVDAVKSGFVGKLSDPEKRRTAFWFMILGPFISALGSLAVRASLTNDLEVFKIIGIYLLGVSVVGVAAYPKSPLLILLILAPLFLLVGFSVFG